MHVAYAPCIWSLAGWSYQHEHRFLIGAGDLIKGKVTVLDDRIDEKGYIIPGVGDAGGYIFGTK